MLVSTNGVCNGSMWMARTPNIQQTIAAMVQSGVPTRTHQHRSVLYLMSQTIDITDVTWHGKLFEIQERSSVVAVCSVCHVKKISSYTDY